MNETSAELTKKLSAAVEKMPAFPRSVQRILELSRDINCQPRELVMVIEKDPVVKKLKASMRQAKRRLTQVAAMEKLGAQKREEKEKKAAAKRETQSRPGGLPGPMNTE